jgi:hypothetical protein
LTRRPTGSTRACGPLDVRVELSSDDGSLEFSGTGKLTEQPSFLRVQLEPNLDVRTGKLSLADALTVELEYPDGSVVTAQGTLPP